MDTSMQTVATIMQMPQAKSANMAASTSVVRHN